MNNKLQQAKNEIAKELNYKDWETCINDQPNYNVENIMDKVAERYHELMSEWISVDDRLPEKGERVLIAHDDFGVQIAYLTMDDLWMIIAFQIKAKFNDHWKPLPNLPQPPKQ